MEVQADPRVSRLWNVIPDSKRVTGPGELSLAAPHLRAEVAATMARTLEGNRWAAAVRALGHPVVAHDHSCPIEEGETSLFPSLHQALASLVPCRSPGAGRPTIVLGNLVFGNHALIDPLERLAADHAEPARALKALASSLAPRGPVALMDQCLLLPGMAKVRGELEHRSFVRHRRLLRFPAILFPAPEVDALRSLAVELGWSPWLASTLVKVRETMDTSGLRSFADFMLVVRAALIRELAALMEVDASAHIPLSFEHLLATTVEGVGETSLARWITEHHTRLRAHLGCADEPRPALGSGTYRVLNYFVSQELVRESDKSIAGRNSEHGWNHLQAGFLDGRVSRDPLCLASRPVATLLEEGYGLSGKLVYHAVSRINRGRVCNLVFRCPPDVFSSLADPARPNRVLPLRSVSVVGRWQPAPRGLSLLAGLDWLQRSPEPRRSADLLFRTFRRLTANPDGDGTRLYLGAPGEVHGDGIDASVR